MPESKLCQSCHMAAKANPAMDECPHCGGPKMRWSVVCRKCYRAADEPTQKAQRAAYMRKYRLEHLDAERARDRARSDRKKRPEFIDRARAKNAERMQATKDFLDAYKLDHGCVDCGYSAHPAALQFDHIQGQKVRPLSRMHSAKREAVLAELAKCVVRCANCHSIRHNGGRRKGSHAQGPTSVP